MSKTGRFVLLGMGILWSLTALIMLTQGCRKQEGVAPQRPKIALVMKSLANEFFKTMEEGARTHQRENAAEYTLIVNGIKNEQDVNRQTEIVELMIAQGVDAIVIAPADSKALVPVCKKALDRGMAVINIDNKFDDGVLADKKIKIPFVGPDNRKGARMAGEYLAQHLHAGDKVAIIEGIPTAFNALQRKLGFEEAMNAAGMNIVARQSGRWEIAEGQKVAGSVLTENPDLKAFLCANDNMALGAHAALKAAQKSAEILVIGYDNISAAHQLLQEGAILCTIDQHADRLAVYGIKYALEVIRKGTTPSDKETPVDLITADALK